MLYYPEVQKVYKSDGNLTVNSGWYAPWEYFIFATACGKLLMTKKIEKRYYFHKIQKQETNIETHNEIFQTKDIMNTCYTRMKHHAYYY